MAEIAEPGKAEPIPLQRRARIPRYLIVDNFWAFAFLALSLIGLVVLTLLPIAISFFLSFTDWDALGAPNFVGLQNFTSLFQDPTFLRALWNTIYYTAVSVPIGMTISLALALALNRSLPGMG